MKTSIPSDPIELGRWLRKPLSLREAAEAASAAAKPRKYLVGPSRRVLSRITETTKPTATKPTVTASTKSGPTRSELCPIKLVEFTCMFD